LILSNLMSRIGMFFWRSEWLGRCTLEGHWGLKCETLMHICSWYGIKAIPIGKRPLGSEWRQYEEAFFQACKKIPVSAYISLDVTTLIVRWISLNIPLVKKWWWVWPLSVARQYHERPEEVAPIPYAKALQFVDAGQASTLHNVSGMRPYLAKKQRANSMP